MAIGGRMGIIGVQAAIAAVALLAPGPVVIPYSGGRREGKRAKVSGYASDMNRKQTRAATRKGKTYRLKGVRP